MENEVNESTFVNYVNSVILPVRILVFTEIKFLAISYSCAF